MATKSTAGDKPTKATAQPRFAESNTRPPAKDSQFARMLNGNPAINIPAVTWDAFLLALANTGNVTKACKMASLDKTTAYVRRQQDADFAELWEQARKIGFARLEDAAYQRAYHGVKRPVFYQGEECATITEYSDQLLMFLLQGNDPRYKRKQEITGADSGPLALLASMDDAGLAQLVKDRIHELAVLQSGIDQSDTGA